MNCANCNDPDAVAIATRLTPAVEEERQIPLCVKCLIGWVQEWMFASVNPNHRGDDLSPAAGGTIQLDWVEINGV